MTRIKLCGLSRPEDIKAANLLRPDYIGFVFAEKSRRYVSPEKAAKLRSELAPGILAVGVFVNEDPEKVADLLDRRIIDIAQLHGTEDEDYIMRLRQLTGSPIIQAFKIRSEDDLDRARKSTADHILLDAGAGDGLTFDWKILFAFDRPYFLAGGLTPENAGEAVKLLCPFAVDVSSGIESSGIKDKEKMDKFVRAVRGAAGKE